MLLKREDRWTSRRLVALSAVALVWAAAGTARAGITNTLVCEMRGGQHAPPVDTPARGCGTFVIDTNENTLSFYIVFDSLLGTENAAHIHGPADIGDVAAVLFPLPAGNPKVGVWNYPENLEDDILNCRTYVNIHSTLHPSGEIRGQICKLVSTLDDRQEVPTTTCPTAGGWGVFNIDVCADTLSYHIVLEGTLCTQETAAHIHGLATHGETAGVLHPLPAGSPKIGVWNYPPEMETDILQGLTYVNIHTDQFPNGAIRGQITNIMVPIDGTQQNPPVTTIAAGCGFMSIDKQDNRLGFYIRYLTPPSGETASHIHGFAPPGMDAGVLFGLPASNPKVGFWDYGAGNEQGILDGLTYINIHSNAFPGGEIRGQIVIPPKKADCPECPWDCGDGDGQVAIVDLLALLAQWGGPGPCDFDGNGAVDIVDLLALLANWGPCP